MGVLTNWVRLQAEHECFFMFADWHALTTAYGDPSELREAILENAACVLAAGVDPKKAVLFRQSDVAEHAELHLLLSMVTPVPWLERVPSYKEQKEKAGDREQATYGFLGYPVLQAADILIYKSSLVPIGDDQVAHLEVAREIARRFNHLYGEVFPEPQPLLTSTPRLPGPDRRKMSKSYGNAIEIGAGKASLEKMVKAMFTDPEKIHMGDKGHPDECVVFAFHQSFNEAAAAEVERGCRDGSRGCVACKKSLLDPMWGRMKPIHDARKGILADRPHLEEILKEGAAKARKLASETMREVRTAMKLI